MTTLTARIDENGLPYVLANDLKKGTVCVLRNGWTATIADNRKGLVRLAVVEGYHTETGSIYVHHIASASATIRSGLLAVRHMGVAVRLSPAQSKQAARIQALGF